MKFFILLIILIIINVFLNIDKNEIDDCKPDGKIHDFVSFREDIINNLTCKELEKNIINNKYYYSNYENPIRDSDGKILIKNDALFEYDKKKYGLLKTYQYASLGKYNK